MAALLDNKFYLDEIYDASIGNPLKALGKYFGKVWDPMLIDAAVRTPGNLLQRASVGLKPIQSGQISWYIFSILIGFLIYAFLFLVKL